MPKVRDAHFFRKVPRDVSEATKLGGIISIFALLTIGWLVREEYVLFRKIKLSTELHLDQSTMPAPLGPEHAGDIRININLTMYRIPCLYAHMQVADHVGSHKMGGVRNIHKVRIDRDGRSLGMFHPHRYQDKAEGHNMAEHVFPWHKQMHTQGDEEHRQAAKTKHLSEAQKNVVKKVEKDMKHSTGKSKRAASTGRRLLSVEEPPVADPAAAPATAAAPEKAATEPAEKTGTPDAAAADTPAAAEPAVNAAAAAAAAAEPASSEPASPSPPATPEADASKPAPAPDTVSSCTSWAGHGECVTNAKYMLKSCETSCAAQATDANCVAWAQSKEGCTTGAGIREFLDKFCATTVAQHCNGKAVESAAAAAPSKKDSAVAHAAAVTEEAAKAAPGGDDSEYVPGPLDDKPLDADEHEFEALVKSKALVMVNFYAPWCYWSNKLAPDWAATQKKLHQRAYAQSVSFVRVDCTTAKGRQLCQHQSVHAFPSIRVYRGSVHAYEPYEFGREENLLWLHLVKLAAEVVIATLKEMPADDRRPYTLQVSHVSQDLKLIMERREQGLDEDWSEDALSAEEEVEEDSVLLKSIDEAVRAIMDAKGVRPAELKGMGGEADERALLQMKSNDVVLGLITNDKRGDEDETMEAWPGSNAHEGCVLFGYIDVSRAPGTLHVAPHSARHSFDFSHVNVSHHIDHLSFGLELPASARTRLPESVQQKLLALDGSTFTSSNTHQTLEHHVNVMPTTFSSSSFANPVETYQFTATSHSRTKDALPSLIISYDVSPIQVRIRAGHQPVSEFIVNLCAVIGGAFAIFGILDGIIFTGNNVIRKKLQMGKQF